MMGWWWLLFGFRPVFVDLIPCGTKTRAALYGLEPHPRRAQRVGSGMVWYCFRCWLCLVRQKFEVDDLPATAGRCRRVNSQCNPLDLCRRRPATL